MQPFSPILRRIAVAKTLGLALGVAIYFTVPLVFPETPTTLLWGLILLMITMAGIVGVVGFYNRVPLFGFALVPWVRGGLMGVWMMLIGVLIGFESLQTLLSGTFGLPAALTSPWLMLIDGFVLGALIDVIVTRLTGRITWPGAGLGEGVDGAQSPSPEAH